MRPLRIAILVAVTGGTACTVGGNAAKWPVAVSPNGATIVASTTSGKWTGELLDVREDGIVLMLARDGKIVLAPYGAVKQLQAPKLTSDYNVRLYGFMDPAARRKFAAVSHFPQGMTDQIRARLLASKGQKEIEVLP
jgi:hypothetical protein